MLIYENKTTMLHIKDLNAWHGNIQIITDISLDISQGSFVGLIGPNGSGKSTLLKSIFGFTRIINGQICFFDKNITKWQSHNHIKHGIAFVPQTKNIFTHLTTRENLEIAWYTLRNAHFQTNLKEVLNLVPSLSKYYTQLAGSLSGWQRQILAIAMALLHKPKLLLLDEPSAWLSPIAMHQIFDNIYQIWQSWVTVIVVEHNVKRVFECATDIIVMEDGHIASVWGEELLKTDKIKQIYFGS